MTKLSKGEKEALYEKASSIRRWYRETGRISVRGMVWFKKTPERWAWLTAEDTRCQREFITLSELKEAVKAVGCTGTVSYTQINKQHLEWPSRPDTTYEDWVSWYDLFGKVVPAFATLAELRDAVRKEGIVAQSRYKAAQKKHVGWPSNPNLYEDWVSWPDLFGTVRDYLTLVQLKKAVKRAGIRNRAAYWEAQVNHEKWPHSPTKSLYAGWVSWPDLFGKPVAEFVSDLSKLQRSVQGEGCCSRREYDSSRREGHPEWPSNPYDFYEEWISWHDLFGKKVPNYLTLPHLKKAVKREMVSTQGQYNEVSKKFPEWPSGPNVFYAASWVSWPDLFGRKYRVVSNFLSLPQLKRAVKAAGVFTCTVYFKEQKNRPDWPSNPNCYYEDWVSWPNLFGRKK